MADGDKPGARIAARSLADPPDVTADRIPPTAPANPAALGAAPAMPTDDNTLATTPSAMPTDANAPLGTMQLPRGAVVQTGAPPPMPDEAAPLLATVMPNTAAPLPSVAPPPMPQDWRYTIDSEIARGGMGRVVNATDTVLGRTVALKEALSVDAESIRRFQRETRITARLEHPAIVPVHDAGFSPSGSPFYVMRKVGGRPLEELVARAETLNARLALVPHIVTAAQAVAHAHDRGIVHRDIKPSNILVGDHGETILIDWGLAKAIGEADEHGAPVQRVIEEDESLKTRAGIVFGTPGFMAPEQLRGNAVDERCDVYALGASLYHLLARRPPHHSKNPDEMMRSAVGGPPRPLSEIVEGVPPELATIVDKALMHDATKRYQNAGALADDLQRFLTGQLVASHYYTPRERVVRFLRKYRAAVGVSITAFVVLVFVAAVLIGQILDERDRADTQARIAVGEKKIAEEAKEHAVRNARELVLANARHAATSDPTRAIALVKPLASSELWREARDVGAAARTHGVAFSMPASTHTLSLELSRDGERALAAGNDGIVRIYEIAKREARVIADMKGAVTARFADGERKILLYQGNRLTILDAATGDKREVTAPTSIANLEIAGPLAYWTDPAQNVWRLDLAGGVPAQVPVAEPVSLVAPSPDGRWVALGGSQHLLVLDRSSPSLPAEILVEGVTAHMTWSAGSDHLIALIDDEVVDILMEPEPHLVRRITVGQRFSVAYSNGRIFSAGPTGVGQVERDGTRIRSPGNEHTLGVFEGRDRVVISAKPQGAIIVLSDTGDHTLACPQPIDRVATSAHGPWIVAATEGRLLVWDLDAIEPRLVTRRQPSTARFVTGDHLIATYEGEPAEWIDLHTKKVTPLGVLDALESIATAPDGTQAVVIALAGRAHLVAGLGTPQAIDGEVVAAAFVDNHRYVLARPTGLVLEDQQLHTKSSLVAHDAPARKVLANEAGWILAVFADGYVWRKNLASGATAEQKLAAQPLPRIALAADGTALLGVGGEVRAWRSDGGLDVLLTGKTQVAALALVAPNRALAVTDDGNGYVTDLRPGSAMPPIEITRDPAIALDGSLVAGHTSVGGVQVIDPLAGWSWRLATPQKGQSPYGSIAIAPDGSRVMAISDGNLLVWTLDLPRGPDATAAWLDKLTNATADRPMGPLGWK